MLRPRHLGVCVCVCDNRCNESGNNNDAGLNIGYISGSDDLLDGNSAK